MEPFSERSITANVYLSRRKNPSASPKLEHTRTLNPASFKCSSRMRRQPASSSTTNARSADCLGVTVFSFEGIADVFVTEGADAGGFEWGGVSKTRLIISRN